MRSIPYATEIADKPELSQEFVSVSTRPLILAFFLRDDDFEHELALAVQIASVHAGGLYYIIIPVKDQEVDSYWADYLKRSEPDVLIAFSESLRNLLILWIAQIQPLCARIFPERDLSSPVIEAFAIPVHAFLADSVYAGDGIIKIASNIEAHPLSFFLKLILGDIPAAYLPALQRFSQIEEDTIPNLTISDYLQYFDEPHLSFRPLHRTQSGLRLEVYLGGHISSVFIICHDISPEDICLFWNARRSAFATSSYYLIPISLFECKESFTMFAQAISAVESYSNHIFLTSASLAPTKLQQIKAAVAEETKGLHNINIGLESGRPFLPQATPYYDEDTQLTLLQDRAFVVRPPKLPIRTSATFGWSIDINARTSSSQFKSYYIPPFPSRNDLLDQDDLNRKLTYRHTNTKRFHNKRLSILTNSNREFLKEELLDMPRISTSFFKSYGMKSRPSEKAKYLKGMINLSQGLEGLSFFQTPSYRALMRAMAEEPKELNGIIQTVCQTDKGLPHDDIRAFVKNLVSKNIIMRGFSIRCPRCDLDQWHSLALTEEFLDCSGCGAKIQIPLKLNFTYKLNELFIRGICEGAIPVALTLLRANSMSPFSFAYEPGLILSGTEGNDIDVDIFAICESNFAFFECKDLERSPSLALSVKEQLLDAQSFSFKCKAALFVTAWLGEQDPELQKEMARRGLSNNQCYIHLSLTEPEDEHLSFDQVVQDSFFYKDSLWREVDFQPNAHI